jgi:hypothetical protein
MDRIIKKALDQIKADENLKKKTLDYVLGSDSKVISIRAASSTGKKQIYVKRLITAACAAVILLALPVGGYAFYKTPTSYVSVDINPSVELGINAFGKVVTVTAYNEDGETVIAGLPLINSSVESAVSQIIKAASRSGYIKDDGSTFISVTAETNNEQKAQELEQDARDGAEDAIESEDDTATIETDTIALDRREEAIALGITPGKLHLIQKLQALDPTIKTEEYKDATVSEIQKKFTELKKDDHGKNDTTDTYTSPSPSAGPASNASPSVSLGPTPSAPPTPDKPGNGNHGGNGNGSKADDDTDGNAANPSPGSVSDPGEPAHGNSGNNGNGNHDKDKDDVGSGRTF